MGVPETRNASRVDRNVQTRKPVEQRWRGRVQQPTVMSSPPVARLSTDEQDWDEQDWRVADCQCGRA